jgi:GDPmannose 4,6-dehydratase
VAGEVGTPRRALLTGLTGQDGSFLAELLLEKGYEVVGLVRRAPTDSLGSSEHLRADVKLIRGDLLESESITNAIASVRPDELYHLAGPSFVPDSWLRPTRTLAAIAGSTATLLEALRDHSPATRAFIAVSGAMFGSAPQCPQREDTPRYPQNPYATAKLAAHELVGQQRRREGTFACSGILYNHESERRPRSFVTRKISRGAAEVKLGLADHITLGDLEAVRDWSFAGDIVRGAWLMLQQRAADDYILASGARHTVGELAQVAFAHLGLDAREHIQVDPSLVRAPEPTPLVGDPSRARERLGWRPTLTFEQLIHRMVDADVRELQAVG